MAVGKKVIEASSLKVYKGILPGFRKRAKSQGKTAPVGICFRKSLALAAGLSIVGLWSGVQKCSADESQSPHNRKLPLPTPGHLILKGGASKSEAQVSQVSQKQNKDQASELVQNSRKLHVYRWKDNSVPAQAVVVAVHGTTQHAGSFNTLAQQLCKHGFIFIGLDLRGHGQRFYKAFKGQPNHRVDYEKSADDLGNLVKKVRASYPGLPVFCLGESVGAAVSTKCMGKYKGIADGLILCSPGTRPRVFNPFMVVPDFIKGVTHLDDPMDVSRYIDHYSSDDRRVSDEMIQDPLSRIKLTPKEILRTAFFIRTTPELAKDVDPKLPVLIVQGELDGIVSKRSTHSIIKNLPGENKELVEFKDAGHVLLGTSYLKPEVVNSVTKWLCEHSDAARTKLIGLHGEHKAHQN